MVGLPVGTPVFTETGPVALTSLEDEPLVTPHSDTAEDAYWRMIDAFLEIRNIVESYPAIATLPFEAPSGIAETEALITSSKDRLSGNVLTLQDKNAIEIALRAMRIELKMMVLHHALILNWEVSAEFGTTRTRVRLPFELLENDDFHVDENWRHGDFGGLPLTNIHIHRHDIGAPTPQQFIEESSVPQELPVLLDRDMFLSIFSHEFSAPSEAQSSIAAKSFNSDFSYFPMRVDSQHPGKIYAQPLRDPPKVRGRPRRIALTERIFLAIWDPKLANAPLKEVFGLITDDWMDHVGGRFPPPPSIDTVKSHLVDLAYWELGKGWNVALITRRKFVNDARI